MTKDQTTSLLAAITARQAGDLHLWSNGTTPVTLTIGSVSKSHQVMHDCIVITDAPAAITDVVMTWVAERKKDGKATSLITVEAGHGALIIR